MGERALLARERADGAYDLYYAHWGGADLSLAREAGDDPGTHPRVDTDPLATAVPWADLLGARLDPLCHAALFVYPTDGDPRAYRPFDPGPLAAPAPLVRVDPADPAADGRVRGLLAGVRAGLVAAHEAGHLDAADAGTAFRAALADRLGDRDLTWVG